MKKTIYFLISLSTPILALAQDGGAMPVGTNPTLDTNQPGNIAYFLNWFGKILSTYIIPIIITLGLILFLWGLISYITAGSDEEKRGTARNYMIYGIIALFVMVSVWGLVAILNRTFGIGQGGAPASLPKGVIS